MDLTIRTTSPYFSKSSFSRAHLQYGQIPYPPTFSLYLVIDGDRLRSNSFMSGQARCGATPYRFSLRIRDF